MLLTADPRFRYGIASGARKGRDSLGMGRQTRSAAVVVLLAVGIDEGMSLAMLVGEFGGYASRNGHWR